MKTYVAKPSTIEKKWYVVDAQGKTLGRLATVVADTLRGKRKATYTPNIDTGDFVVVINADKVVVTGNKAEQKMYYHHSGYRVVREAPGASPGGDRAARRARHAAAHEARPRPASQA